MVKIPVMKVVEKMSEIDIDRFDVLHRTLIFRVHSPRGSGKAEYTKIMDIDGFTVEQRRTHRFYEISQHTLNVTQRQGTFLFHRVSKFIQVYTLSLRHKLRMILHHPINLSRVFTTHSFKWYCHDKLKIEN